jgi:hypothetical protein
MKRSERKLAPYAKARILVRDGDTLLFRPCIRWYAFWEWPWLLIWLFGAPTGHTHAAKVAWMWGRLFILQQTSGASHIQRLSEIVAQWPGKIDVYRPMWLPSKRSLQTRESLAEMARVCGRNYGWYNLLRVALRFCPVLWRLLPRDEDDAEESAFPLFCSAAVSRADRCGGLDPVPRKPDRLTTPSDLAMSSVAEYQFTLI